MNAHRLNEVSLYALPGLKYALVRNDEQKAKAIIDFICKYFAVSEEMMKARNRSPKYVYPRQLLLFAIARKTTLTTGQIGEMVGGRDHATVIYSKRIIANDMATNPERKSEIQYILDRCLL